MNNIIHCPICQEDMNPADWEANEGCCCHCGREIASPGDWANHRQGFNVLRSRLDLQPRFNFSRGSIAELNLSDARRIYA
ncbi:MAG: hypothetical protein AAF558_14575 [Verrucomicrobiota bacterium]